MTTVSRTIEATPEQVWSVLAEGWLYPLWVVGASRMRAVDEDWPATGSRLHHSVGAWPLLIDDYTEVLEEDPGRRLKLRARAWPMGEAQVEITVTPRGSSTDFSIAEDAVAGPGRLVPGLLRGAALKWRNVEAVRRFAFLAEQRAAAPGE